MAHSKSSKKRIRQSAVRRVANRSQKSALRTLVKKFDVAIESGDAAGAAGAFKAVQQKLDKVVIKKIMHKGTASRVKSRLSARLRALQAKAPKAK